MLERLVPHARLEGGVRELATGPPDLADMPVAAHGLVVPEVELVRSPQIEPRVRRGKVVERAGQRHRRACALGQLDRPLEVVLSALLAEVPAGSSDRRESIGLDRVEA